MGSPCLAVRSLRTPGFCVGEYVLPPGYRLGRHTHARPGVVIGVSGAWVGDVGGREHGCGPGDLVVLPDAATHRERSVGGSRCLLVAVVDDGGLERRTRRCLDRDRRVDAFVDPGLVRNLAAEIESADALAADVVDALLIEVLARLGAAPLLADAVRWLADLRDALHAGFLDPPSVSELASAAGRSREHATRCFRRAFGVSPGAYVRARRLDHAAVLLAESDRAIAGIARECGFSDQSHLTRLFRRRFGVTPASYRARRGRRDRPTRSRIP